MHTLGPSTDVQPSACLNCGMVLDVATVIDSNEGPSPGDATICLRCGHVMMFADDMTFREPTDDEMYMIAGDERLVAAQNVIAEVRKDWKD